MTTEVTPIKTFALVWIALLVLLAITSTSAYFNLGWGNTAINFAVAVGKLLLIVIFFMHLFKGDAAVRLTVSIALFLLALMAYLSFSDYLTRDTISAPWRAPDSHVGTE